jgi:hypothetical protein
MLDLEACPESFRRSDRIEKDAKRVFVVLDGCVGQMRPRCANANGASGLRG